ncbi:MAG: hypothetical protein Q4P18_03195 [Methanobrevibacter sp.]|uniref:hypothetical protein n=1 Tax=Methanobrevibacter sp. TaxID=66852 RepID=UPI0026E0642A|nr:hypothetical protein [Methanobrevibacter sp.]MDO5848518.1 hypothetical protein [Methanobrevibacter sp.]
MVVINFDFLKDTYPELYKYGHEMEENIDINEKKSATCAGEFLDELVKLVFNKNGLNYDPDSLMGKGLDELQMNKVIPKDVYSLLIRAKQLRDHADLKGGHEDIIELHAVMGQLAEWFYRKYEDPSFALKFN